VYYNPANAGVPFGTPINCQCSTWDRTFEFDAAFNTFAVPNNWTFIGYQLISGFTCTGFAFNWDAQGLDHPRPIKAWYFPDPITKTLLPVKWDATYESGFFEYSLVSLNIDWDFIWTAQLQKYCLNWNNGCVRTG